MLPKGTTRSKMLPLWFMFDYGFFFQGTLLEMTSAHGSGKAATWVRDSGVSVNRSTHLLRWVPA